MWTSSVTVVGVIFSIFLYKRTPLLKNINNKWVNFFLRVGFIFIPANITYIALFANQEALAEDFYAKYA